MYDEAKLNELLTHYTGKLPDELLHLLGHDIRAQLNNIIGNMQLVKLSLTSDNFTAEDQKSFVEEVIDASRMIDLIIEAGLKSRKD